MKKYKSVTEVLKRGQIEVNVPVFIILIVVPIFSIFLCSILFPKEYVLIGFFLGLILAFFLAWFWWSYKIVKWRIWAFENTKKSDWSSLKKRAVTQKLIWNDGSVFEKTEIRSNEQKRKIEKINSDIRETQKSKAEIDNSFNLIKDDPKIPSKIEYQYKRSEIAISALLPIILIAIGFYLVSVEKLVIGILSIGLAIYHIDLHKIKDNWKREIQFSIGDEGIEIKKYKHFDIMKWDSTQNISVDTESGILKLGVWKTNQFHEITFDLNDYPIGDYDDFLYKINIYLKRSMK